MPLRFALQRHGLGVRGRDAPARPAPGAAARAWAVRLLSAPIHLYRWLISPVIGPRCRFLPTCSDYALDALASHGAVRGGWLALRRIGRCHPFGGAGFDPVPPPDATHHRRLTRSR